LKVLVTIRDKEFELFISEDEILAEVAAMGKQLSSDYQGKEVVFVAMLNGAFMFAADLMKKISIPCTISFIKVSSYEGESSTGKITELIGINEDLSGKHIVLVEDIVDTGMTIESILPKLDKAAAASVSICTLLFKPEAFKGTHHPEHIGFSIPNRFVVGYGLDYDGYGRNLNAIYQLKKED
jgi:hypoxanthine phosphoribosyltransferase